MKRTKHDVMNCHFSELPLRNSTRNIWRSYIRQKIFIWSDLRSSPATLSPTVTMVTAERWRSPTVTMVTPAERWRSPTVTMVTPAERWRSPTITMVTPTERWRSPTVTMVTPTERWTSLELTLKTSLMEQLQTLASSAKITTTGVNTP